MIRCIVRYGLPALIFPVAAWAAEGVPVQDGPSQVLQQPPALPVAPQAPASAPPAAQQSGSAFALLREIETLKAEVSRLRGQNEMLEHQLESLSKRQSDLYLDLDKRLEELSKRTAGPAQADTATVAAPAAGMAAPAQALAATTASTAPAAASSPAKEDPLAESKAYEEALDQFKGGNYDKAIAGFSDFLKAYPNSTLAANALYWTGYAYYARKDYKNALVQQTRLVSTYPQNPKVPDAMLNIANSQLELKETASAKKTLQEIVSRYPGTSAAAIAAKRLELLK